MLQDQQPFEVPRQWQEFTYAKASNISKKEDTKAQSAVVPQQIGQTIYFTIS